VSAPLLESDLSLAEAHKRIAVALVAADIDESRLEARLLVQAATGLDLAGLIRHEQAPLGAAADTLANLVARRLGHEPISRIVGKRGFYGLEFGLNAATLDPRPDTETLVDAVLEIVDARDGRQALLSILDLGTGTGAILLALLYALPQARGIGVDIAPEAVAMAAENAVQLGLAARSRFVVRDMLDRAGDDFDIIVSNPPYIPSGEIAGLDPEVRLHDPSRALDGGADGLDFYRLLASKAGAHLKPGGWLAMEVGAGQAGDVLALLARQGWQDCGSRRDLGGIDRVVFAQHRST